MYKEFLGRDTSQEGYWIINGVFCVGEDSYSAKPANVGEVLVDLRRRHTINVQAAEENKNKPFAHYLDSAYSLYSNRAARYAILINRIEQFQPLENEFIRSDEKPITRQTF